MHTQLGELNRIITCNKCYHKELERGADTDFPLQRLSNLCWTFFIVKLACFACVFSSLCKVHSPLTPHISCEMHFRLWRLLAPFDVRYPQVFCLLQHSFIFTTSEAGISVSFGSTHASICQLNRPSLACVSLWLSAAVMWHSGCTKVLGVKVGLCHSCDHRFAGLTSKPRWKAGEWDVTHSRELTWLNISQGQPI